MFTVHKYLNKLFKIKWYFKKEDLNMLQDLLLVDFKSQDDHYVIDNLHYTYLDVLIGMEDLNFAFEKINDEISIKIL